MSAPKRLPTKKEARAELKKLLQKARRPQGLVLGTQEANATAENLVEACRLLRELKRYVWEEHTSWDQLNDEVFDFLERVAGDGRHAAEGEGEDDLELASNAFIFKKAGLR